MPNKEFLTNAKKNQKDEFYTQYSDIQKEINAYLEYNPDTFRDKTILLPCDDPEWSNFTKFFAKNFNKLGLKKLISTSYATESKNKALPKGYQFSIDDYITDFEKSSPQYNESLTGVKGKIFTLTRRNKKILDVDDLDWKYLEGDGDFRSEEVTKLRDEADIIITNPPFSKFREFLPWIISGKKQFMIIANLNCITYKEVFPLIKENKAWLGNGMGRWISGFIVPENYDLYGTEARIEDGKRIVSTNNCLWLTNIENGKRHQPIPLMSKSDNLKYSKHKNDKKWRYAYRKYVNYDVMEVPFYDSIPSDYDGVMGVPITTLDKFCPEQFELIGMAEDNGKGFSGEESKWDGKNPHCVVDGANQYKRIFIRYTKKWIASHPDDFRGDK